jgi:PAS domain S-box-containing protein
MSRSSRDEQSACSDGEALRRRLRELEERLQQRDAELDALRSARPDPDQKPDLHDKLRLLQRAVEQSPVSVVITDARGDIQYVNPHFTTLTGYTREEALGRNPRILKSDRQPRSFYRELWQTITAGQDWSGEFCNLKKNGEEYWEQATISPVKNDSGKIAHFLAVKEDVTEKRRALLQLRESEERFRQIVEGTDNIVTRVDAQGRYLYLNTAAQELFGPQARLGDLAFENVHPEDQDETMRAYGRWLDRQTPRIRFENRVLSSQGEPRNIHWTISFQFDENGRLEYATSIGHDITDLRQLQRLRDDVDRITRHDLKGPLLGIISVPQLLMEEENITTEQRTLLKAMEEAGYHMLRLINLSLDIYKIETGVYRLHPRRVDLHSVLRRVVSEVCRGFLHRSIEVHRADLDAHSDAGGTAEAPPKPGHPLPRFRRGTALPFPAGKPAAQCPGRHTGKPVHPCDPPARGPGPRGNPQPPGRAPKSPRSFFRKIHHRREAPRDGPGHLFGPAPHAGAKRGTAYGNLGPDRHHPAPAIAPPAPMGQMTP